MAINRCASAGGRTFLAAVLLSWLAGCAPYNHEVAPLDGVARDQIGEVTLEVARSQPIVAIDQPLSGKGRGGFGAGVAPADPFGLAQGIAIGIVAAPIGAIVGATVTPTEEEAKAAHDAILAAIGATNLESQVPLAIESAMTGRYVAPGANPASLELRVVGPWLALSNEGAIPSLTVHAKLRTSEACLTNRHWRWNGDGQSYLELGTNDGQAYSAQIRDGIEALAEAIATDLFFATSPRIVAYRDKKSLERAETPLMVIEPGRYQNQIASWDDPTAKASGNRMCSGFAGMAAAKVRHTHHW